MLLATHAKDDPRARLLAAADHLFYEQGYQATGVNQIIAEANVAKATFYAHFPSKDDLALAYLEGRSQDWMEAMEEVLEAHASPDEQVLALFDFVGAFVEKNGMRGCAFLNMASEFPDADAPPRRFIAEFKSDLRDHIQKVVQPLFPEDPAGVERKAAAVFLLLEAAIAEAPAVDALWPVEDAREAARTFLSASPPG